MSEKQNAKQNAQPKEKRPRKDAAGILEDALNRACAGILDAPGSYAVRATKAARRGFDQARIEAGFATIQEVLTEAMDNYRDSLKPNARARTRRGF